MLNIRKFTFNAFAENTYVLDEDGRGYIIIDPGALSEVERKVLDDALAGQKPVAILLTHAHPDHIAGVSWLQKKYGTPVYMHPADKPIPQKMVGRVPLEAFDFDFSSVDIEDGQTLSFPEAGIECKVIHTPGHTPGGVCFHFEKQDILFTGDTLFRGAIGRTDLPLGEYDDLIRSIMDKVMGLPGKTEVFPGHAGNTSISEERTENPFLQPFNEPEEDQEASI